MSIRAMVWAFDARCPSPAAKLVLLKLADHANDTGECWPSQGRIAADCGLSRETVNRQVKLLVDAGFISVEHRLNGVGQLPNRYVLRCDIPSHPLCDPVTPPCDVRSHPPVTSDHTEPLRLEPEEDPLSKPNGLDAPQKGKKRKAAFPPDWQPDEQDASFARKRGRDDAWIAREGERCRDHHVAKGNLFADRHAAWRTWVMNAPEFERVYGSPARPPKTADELREWHAENYATRRVMLNTDERTSPTDPDGKWFNADLVAAAEAKIRRAKVRA